MKMQIAVAVGILLTLGTAVSATLVNDKQAVQAPVAQSTVTTASLDVLAMLEARASSSASIPLSRPL
jgi:hypothetical protein